MSMNRAISYRLYPGTLRRAQLLAQIAGANRYVWNWAIGRNDDRMRAYREGRGEKPAFSFFALGKEFTALRNSAGHEWIRELPYHEVRFALKRYADAMREAVRGKRGFPCRKHAEQRRDQFTIPQDVKMRDGCLHVPKVGWLPIRRRGGDPYTHGVAKQAVVRCGPCGRWYATIFWGDLPDAELTDNGQVLGVDMNVRQITGSDGGRREVPRRALRNIAHLEQKAAKYERRMKRRQRVPLLDRDTGEPRRKKNGEIIYTNSKRREICRVRLARTRAKIANVRRNWRHHISADFAKKYSAVVIEDLQTRNMTKSARGTRDNPGRNVRAKRGLNRAILSTGWADLARMLDYKMRQVVRVPPQNTSRACSRCGHVAAENRKTQAAFKCVSCGFKSNADANAAINILRRGLSRIVRRGARERQDAEWAEVAGAGHSARPSDLLRLAGQTPC